MGKTVAEVLWDVLVEYGVDHVFGLPGDSVDPLLEPLRHDRRIRFVQVRHEEAGAFMASAMAKKTGRLAACLGTAGPGAIHLLNGLYDAKMDHAPVIALTGQVGLANLGTDYFQEVDLLALFADVAVYNYQVTAPAQIGVMAAMACRTALAKRAVAHLSFPFEVPTLRVEGPLRHFTVVNHSLDAVPVDALLDDAAERIQKARRPVILAGRGALGARRELLALAERNAMAVVNTLPAKGVIADDHPLALGGLGLLGAKPAHTAMEECDLCLLVGTSYPYLEFLPHHAQIIQIDWEASQIGKRHQVDLGLVGSAGPTLTALAQRIRPRTADDFLRRLQNERRRWLYAVEAEALRTGHEDKGVHPQWIADRLFRTVEPDANISVDVGNSLVWMARNFQIKDHGWLVSGWLGSMGFGLPAAMAAKLAEPRRQSVAVAGDGGFAMLMADFVTAVKYDLPITVVVLNNHRLAMIKFEQEVHGMPEFGTDLVNPDFAEYARAAGGQGFSVTARDELEPALNDALHARVPTIVDVLTNPGERPMPPRVTLNQARGYAEALFRETFGL